MFSHDVLRVEDVLEVAEFAKSMREVFSTPRVPLQELIQACPLAPSSQTRGFPRKRRPLVGRAARGQSSRCLVDFLKCALELSAKQHSFMANGMELNLRRVARTFSFTHSNSELVEISSLERCLALSLLCSCRSNAFWLLCCHKLRSCRAGHASRGAALATISPQKVGLGRWYGRP
eukprot:6204352-Pleurochrysis_carterae.AAC.1